MSGRRFIWLWGQLSSASHSPLGVWPVYTGSSSWRQPRLWWRSSSCWWLVAGRAGSCPPNLQWNLTTRWPRWPGPWTGHWCSFCSGKKKENSTHSSKTESIGGTFYSTRPFAANYLSVAFKLQCLKFLLRKAFFFPILGPTKTFLLFFETTNEPSNAHGKSKIQKQLNHIIIIFAIPGLMHYINELH